MKNPQANKISVSVTPLIIFCLLGTGWFGATLALFLFSKNDYDVCWESGILGVMSYGFMAVRNFIENAHFENMNNNVK